MTRVFKFGGGLMKHAVNIRKVAALIQDYANEPLVVVVSALGKSTNALEVLYRSQLKKEYETVERTYTDLRKFHFEIAEELFGNARHFIFDELNDLFTALRIELEENHPDRYMGYDQTVCFGEQFSSAILHHYLQEQGLKNHLIDARSLIVTDSNYTAAKVDWKYTGKTIDARIRAVLDGGMIALTQGFIGADHSGKSTTVGREGSDFTAAVIGNILEADEVSIWKDVPGLMNADPQQFPDCIKLENISYHEAIELAFYGAKVVHPRTIQPVQQKNIPLYIRSFSNPDGNPTVINAEKKYDERIHKVILKENQTLLSIASKDLAFIAEENLTKIFEVLAKHKIHINLMQHSAISFSVCFGGDQDKLQALLAELGDDFTLKYNSGLTLYTIRHYTEDIIERLISGRKLYLEQKSRATVQLLVK